MWGGYSSVERGRYVGGYSSVERGIYVGGGGGYSYEGKGRYVGGMGKCHMFDQSQSQTLQLNVYIDTTVYRD